VLQPLFLWIDGFSYEWFLVHVDGVKFGYYYIDDWLPNETPELIRVVGAFLFSIAAALLLRLLVRLVNRIFRFDGGQNRLGS
jgi:peptidoglycan/LPS O-acetylase OafA/YrhL